MVLSFVDHYFTLHVRLPYVHLHPVPHPQLKCTVQEATSTLPSHRHSPLQLQYLHSAEGDRACAAPLYPVRLQFGLFVSSVSYIRLTQYRSTTAVLVPLWPNLPRKVPTSLG